MLIEELTKEEFAEVRTLANKGWDACDEAEKKRWAQLYAKAKLALSKRGVLSAIELVKYMTGEDNDI